VAIQLETRPRHCRAVWLGTCCFGAEYQSSDYTAAQAAPDPGADVVGSRPRT